MIFRVPHIPCRYVLLIQLMMLMSSKRSVGQFIRKEVLMSVLVMTVSLYQWNLPPPGLHQRIEMVFNIPLEFSQRSAHYLLPNFILLLKHTKSQN